MKTTLRQGCSWPKKPHSPSCWAGFEGGDALAARHPQGWAPRGGEAGRAVMVELVHMERVCLCGKHCAPALLSPYTTSLPAKKRLAGPARGQVQAQQGPSSASSAPRDVRLWQHLLAPGVTFSEKMEISTASEGAIILSDRALRAARLGLSCGTASVL